jgi:hypothetical protein
MSAKMALLRCGQKFPKQHLLGIGLVSYIANGQSFVQRTSILDDALVHSHGS